MKALSLYQPWLAAILDGFKTIENRSKQYGFSTPFPQRIALHASKTYDPSAPLRLLQIARAIESDALEKRVRLAGYSETFLEKGALVGVCKFIDAGTPDEIRAKYPADAPWIFENAAWCYVVRMGYRFPRPIPYRGQQGFFEVPDEIIPCACGLTQGCACGGPTH